MRTTRRRADLVRAEDGNELERLALLREYRTPSDVRRHLAFIDRKICCHEDVLDG